MFALIGTVAQLWLMEKFTIEIETSAGWVMFHSIMRTACLVSRVYAAA